MRYVWPKICLFLCLRDKKKFVLVRSEKKVCIGEKTKVFPPPMYHLVCPLVT